MQISLKTFGKINYYLDVSGKDNKGYHLLDMKNVSISLHDIIDIRLEKGNGIIDVSFKNANIDKTNNTAYKAVVEFKKAYDCLNNANIFVSITKGIPVGAGLGGSSADASGVLVGLSKLFSIDLHELEVIANKVGSDVAYMLYGGFYNVKGTGDVLVKANGKLSKLIVAKPYGEISTKRCYELYDTLSSYEHYGCVDEYGKDIFNCNCYNALTNSSVLIDGTIKKLLEYLKSLKANACFMTGSGNAVIGYFKDESVMYNAVEQIKNLDYIQFADIVDMKENGVEFI